ncbi:MarR family transcriptional regulator [Allokutzneria albata]|uniref:MarR family protein n=1 Tax=Allokutzneria albata TaxID=211114 RepID=A0A1G9S8V8_ALLAB|nr:helix-turn-helix domain-containing protein [Allokutzneria albata]SDM31894.1 MarR family protein [Allokutzneria albata]
MRRQHPRIPGEHIDLLHLVGAEEGSVTVAELARILRVSTTAVLRAATRLHAAGLPSCDTTAEPEHLRCRLTAC